MIQIDLLRFLPRGDMAGSGSIKDIQFTTGLTGVTDVKCTAKHKYVCFGCGDVSTCAHGIAAHLLVCPVMYLYKQKSNTNVESKSQALEGKEIEI